jgi:hypothetical protein
MILKRTEKDDIVKGIYKSSNVLASKYDKASGELTITFKKGTSYSYKGVSVTDYTRFEISESQGKVLNSTIKSNYEATKNEDVDVLKIVAAVDKEQANELKEIEAGIITLMDKTIKGYAKKEVMDMSLLAKVQYMISKYQNELND